MRSYISGSFFGGLILILLAACAPKPAVQESGNQVAVDSTALQSGDLLFVGLPMSYTLDPAAENEPATLETCAGDSLNVIHVAILEVCGDSVWVIDATLKHNVDRYPLDTFLADFTLPDGSLPLFYVMRLRDNHNAAQFVANAKQFIGRPYDCQFLADNEAQFCSELVRNSYVSPDGSFIFEEYPMDFQKKDGTFPLYWQQLFQLIGQQIPQAKSGTTPAQMMCEPVLKLVRVGI